VTSWRLSKGPKANPGVLSEVDLSIYQVKRGAMPSVRPNHGHEAAALGGAALRRRAWPLGQILGCLGKCRDSAQVRRNAQVLRLIGDASRLAFADRAAISRITIMCLCGWARNCLTRLSGERCQICLRATTPARSGPAGAPAFDHALNLADDISIELCPRPRHVSDC